MSRNESLAYARARRRPVGMSAVCAEHNLPERTFRRLVAKGVFGQVFPIGAEPHVDPQAVAEYVERTLTISEAMQLTGLSKSELHRRKELGEFGPFQKIGRHHKLFEYRVEAWLDGQVFDPLK